MVVRASRTHIPLLPSPSNSPILRWPSAQRNSGTKMAGTYVKNMNNMNHPCPTASLHPVPPPSHPGKDGKVFPLHVPITTLASPAGSINGGGALPPPVATLGKWPPTEHTVSNHFLIAELYLDTIAQSAIAFGCRHATIVSLDLLV